MTWRRKASCCTPWPAALTQCFFTLGKATVVKMNTVLNWTSPLGVTHSKCAKSLGKNNVWQRETMLSVKYLRQKRASSFPTLVSYSSQLSRRMLVFVWVKQLRRRAFIVRVSDCVSSVGTKCLQSQHSRWTYTWCNVELVRVWLHVTETLLLVCVQGRRTSTSTCVKRCSVFVPRWAQTLVDGTRWRAKMRCRKRGRRRETRSFHHFIIILLLLPLTDKLSNHSLHQKNVVC